MPNVLVDIGPSTVVTVGPFQVGVDVRLVHLPRFPSDPAARTSVELAPSHDRRGAPPDPSSGAVPDGDLSFAIWERGPIGALRRALRVIEAVGEVMIALRPAREAAPLPLRHATDPGAIVRYLMEDGARQDRIGELRTALADRIRSARGLVIVPKDGEA